ncbi:MAG: hypothetical protein GY835_21395 [bacterium]|nr:hypothetical protein [bacterium]
MKRSFALKSLTLLFLTCLIMISACSNDDTTTSTGSTSQFSPLTANYLPIEAGAFWDFVRIERGVEGGNPTEIYYNPDTPAGLTHWSVVDNGGELTLVMTNTDMTGTVDNEVLEIVITADQNGIDFQSVSLIDWNDDSSDFFFENRMPHKWIEFGSTQWEWSEEYTGETMSAPYDGDEIGLVLPSEALGFEYDRTIYDGSGQPGSQLFDIDDIDNDEYLDGIYRSAIRGQVRAEENFAFISLNQRLPEIGSLLEDYCPNLVGMNFDDCKWIALSVYSDFLISNQADRNAAGGTQAINEEYIHEDALFYPIRRDIQLMLLAPGIGPLMVVTCVDMDKSGTMNYEDMTIREFQPDVFHYDILQNSSTLTP